VIHEVDDAVRKLVLRDAVSGSGVDVSLEAPTKEWAARRNAPTVNVYLYDVREDLMRRQVLYEEVRGPDGRVLERRPPPRRFKLSYLVTVWTQRPEDEHRLLSALLSCFLRHEALPPDVLTGTLADSSYATLVSVALPPPQDRSLADVWSALGGELKPSLDLVLTAPVDTAREAYVGPPVVEEPRFSVVRPDADAEAGPRGRRRRTMPAHEPPPKPEETKYAGKDDTGRGVRIRDVGR
jgi:hypothetical protein